MSLKLLQACSISRGTHTHLPKISTGLFYSKGTHTHLSKNYYRPVLFLEAHIHIFLKLVQACSISNGTHTHLSKN